MTTENSTEAPTRKQVLVKWVKRLLPWASLIAGIVSAFMMDRSPKKAWLFIAMASLGWVALIGFTYLSRFDPEKFDGKKRLVVVGLQFASLIAIQNVMQNCLLFALPFYVLAASFIPTHIGFLVILGGITALTLWDPVYEALVAVHPIITFALQAFATFVAMNAVLPPFGLSNRASLIVAGVVTCLGIPLLALMTLPRGDDEESIRARRNMKRGAIAAAVVAVVLVPTLVLVGGAMVIPPAPMRLVDVGIGTKVAHENAKTRTGKSYRKIVVPDDSKPLIAPSQLVCISRIGAPVGINDRLFHIWEHDGHQTDRIALNIKVKPTMNTYATYSRKKRLGQNPEGRWTCTVETESGQLLGRTSRFIKSRPAAP